MGAWRSSKCSRFLGRVVSLHGVEWNWGGEALHLYIIIKIPVEGILDGKGEVLAHLHGLELRGMDWRLNEWRWGRGAYVRGLQDGWIKNDNTITILYLGLCCVRDYMRLFMLHLPCCISHITSYVTSPHQTAGQGALAFTIWSSYHHYLRHHDETIPTIRSAPAVF